MARLTANLFHLVLMPVRNHLTYITYLNFCFYILPVTIHRTRRNMQFCSNVIRLAVGSNQAEYIHFTLSKPSIKFRTANHILIFTFTSQRTFHFLEYKLTVFIYIEIILVIFPKIATDETMNHPELIMPPIHCAGRINLHQPGMSFRISVPDNGKHILKGCPISILEYNCRLSKFFHHDISFRSVIELDISYWIHF